MKAAVVILAVLWAFMLGRQLTSFYCRRGILKVNYRGIMVAPSLGPALILAYLPVLAVEVLRGENHTRVLAVAALFLGVSLCGLWDDLIDEQVSGFKGHLGSLYKGQLTSGLLKMVTALLVGLLFVAALPDLSPLERVLALLVVLLSANGLNLLDRRPGRALKAFFGGMLLILLFTRAGGVLELFVPLLAISLIIAPFDFNAEGMLGDCGSNMLGAALGTAAVFSFSLHWQWALLLAWAVVHGYAEFASISCLVDRYPLLKHLDKLGRSREKLT